MTPQDDNNNDDLFDMVKKAGDFIEENEDMIRDLLGSGSSLDLGSDSPLSESLVEDDHVKIVADIGEADFSSVGIDTDGDKVVIDVNGKKIEATVPEDTKTEDPDATYNNGILEVKFGRGGGDD